jgi:hypothetical protein
MGFATLCIPIQAAPNRKTPASKIGELSFFMSDKKVLKAIK